MRSNIVSIRRFGERLLAYTLIYFVIACNAVQAEPIRIVVLGDSLSSGYQLQADQAFPAVLEQKLRSEGYDVTVLNMSIPGETTTGGFARLPKVIEQNPDIVVVQLGGNDALRGAPIENINYNLFQTYDVLARKQIAVIMCGIKAPPNMGRTYTARFNQLYDYYKGRTTVFPFFLKDVVAHPEYNLADGYHPNAMGVRVIVNNFTPYIAPIVRQRIEWRRTLYEYKE